MDSTYSSAKPEPMNSDTLEKMLDLLDQSVPVRIFYMHKNHFEVLKDELDIVENKLTSETLKYSRRGLCYIVLKDEDKYLNKVEVAEIPTDYYLPRPLDEFDLEAPKGLWADLEKRVPKNTE